MANETNVQGTSGEASQELVFDGSGDCVFTISRYCPVSVKVAALITGLDAVFDIGMETNVPEKKSWDNVKPNQEINTVIKTNVFSKTQITFKIHSSVPNSKATATLKYSV
jgi:hypothetical protein